MANVKVTCPHCGGQTWVREHYNDPCQHCGKTVPDPRNRPVTPIPPRESEVILPSAEPSKMLASKIV